MNFQAATGGLAKDFLASTNALPPPQGSGLAHSASTPSFHSSFSNALGQSFPTLNSSSSNPLNPNQLGAVSLNSSNPLNNSNSLASNVLNSSLTNTNPLAAHNFPPLNSNYVSTSLNSSSSATPLAYSTALRSSPANTGPQQIPRPPSPPQTQTPPDGLLRTASPDQTGVSAFQVNFYSPIFTKKINIRTFSNLLSASCFFIFRSSI